MTEENKNLSIDDRLSLIDRTVDKVSHIEIDQVKFKASEDKSILFICPAKVYELNEVTGECIIKFENCIECGTCQVGCREYVKWRVPNAGFGVSYKYG